MATDGRTYIRVHDGMPDHHKIEVLSDRAFRLLVETWCWCSRHLTDGHVPRANWNKRGTAAARRELIAANLADDHGADGVQMHDYLEHQRSRAEVEQITAARRQASVKANHSRWHKGGRVDPECPLCGDPKTDPKTDPSAEPRSPVDNSTQTGSNDVAGGNGKATGEFVSNGNDRSHSGDSLTTASHLTSVAAKRGASDLGSAIGSGSIPRGRGRGRSSSGYVGGEGPEVDARASNAPAPIFDPVNPRCANHAHIPVGEQVPRCKACADVRRHAEQQNAEQQNAEQARRAASRAAADDCTRCDDSGWLLGDDHTPIEPARRCDHRPDLRAVGQ